MALVIQTHCISVCNDSAQNPPLALETVYTKGMKNENDYFNSIDDRMAALDTDDETAVFMADFMVQTLSSVLLDGAVSVTDPEGWPPSTRNNYLLSDDGHKFTGRVRTAAQTVYDFKILENVKTGKWAVSVACEAVA